MAKKVLVVDDEKLIVKGIRFSLEQDGMEVDCAYDGEEALSMAKEKEYDMILLDLMLPKLDGLSVCQQIREFSNVPIVMLTAKGEDMDKILGLEYGADDYITKPFNILEVKARIKAIMRRAARQEPKEEKAKVVQVKDLRIDCESRRVFIGDREINLTAKEFDVLELLVFNPNKVYSRENLLNIVWGYEYPGDVRTVDVHIRRLREKIEKNPSEPKYVHTQSGELVTISRLKNKEKWKFLRSLRFRITVILVIIGIVPCVILEKSIVNSYEDRAVSVRSITVKNQCDIICNQLIQQNYMEDPGSDVINGQLSMLTNIYGGRILIIDQDFRVIKDTYDMDRGKTIISQEVIQSFQGKETSQYDRKNNYLEMTVRIQNTETKETLGVMLVSISTDEIRANMKILETKGMTILSIITLLVLVFGYLLAGILMKPFQKVTRSIEDITDGYLDESISVPDYLETELITDAFNKMLTRVRTLDDSRQEFVSNVSHELKTPLASMKVLADSLNGQEGVPVELYQEFMQDITSEIDRENQIITDLLSLVKMDKKVADLNITQVNINELLEQLLKRLHPIAAQKNVELILDSFRPVNAEVDATKLSLAFSNLIENGIKYNNENGWVRVSLNADHKYFYVTVADSGIGIPEESIAHIFERFYRVDKSHSREIGGTGLGLAIARSAIVMHRGAIRVYSKENEGTTFSVRIPLNYVM